MTTVATALSLAISLALGYLILRCWRGYWVDNVRHALFCARDELFIYAVDHGLVDHEAHRLLRERANVFIRYIDTVSFWHVAALIGADRAFPHRTSDDRSSYSKAVRSLPTIHQEKLEGFRTRIASEVFRYLYRSSLLMRIATLCAIPFFLLYGRGQQPTPNRIDLIERDAMERCAA